MLTVHHLASSQSERIVWLCEELGLSYELRRYEREPDLSAPAEYKALHPIGTAPIITDGDFALGESGAIVEYICRRHAGGRLILGPDHPDFADYLFWFHFANGSLVPAFMVEYITQHTPDSAGTTRSQTRSDRAMALVESRLGEASFFAGEEFTAADIMMCMIRFAAMRDLTKFPNIRAYLQRVAVRPACQRAMARAEPDRPSDFP